MVVRVNVTPELLTWATERAGWDDDDIARRAPHFHEWVSGRRAPTLNQIKKFAADTYTPFAALFLEEPPAEYIPIPDMRTLGNREVAKPSANLLDTIYECQTRQAWYMEYAEEMELPEVPFIGTATAQTPTAQLAAKMSELLGFDVARRCTLRTISEARSALIDVVEQAGVLVMVSGIVGNNTHRKLNVTEFRGFALADVRAPLIFVNGADTQAAQIFTILHELAHLWRGHSALSDAEAASQAGNAEELWCNRVAAEVLIPQDELHKHYAGRLDEDELERLAGLFKASTLVVLKRLFDVGLLTWDSYQEAYDAERRRVLKLIDSRPTPSSGGDFYRTHPRRVSARFARAVVESAFAGATPFRDAYRLLGTKKPSTFENLADRLLTA